MKTQHGDFILPGAVRDVLEALHADPSQGSIISSALQSMQCHRMVVPSYLSVVWREADTWGAHLALDVRKSSDKAVIPADTGLIASLRKQRLHGQFRIDELAQYALVIESKREPSPVEIDAQALEAFGVYFAAIAHKAKSDGGVELPKAKSAERGVMDTTSLLVNSISGLHTQALQPRPLLLVQKPSANTIQDASNRLRASRWLAPGLLRVGLAVEGLPIDVAARSFHVYVVDDNAVAAAKEIAIRDETSPLASDGPDSDTDG